MKTAKLVSLLMLSLVCRTWAAPAEATGFDKDGVLLLPEKQTVKINSFCVVSAGGYGREAAGSGVPAKQATSAVLRWDSSGLEVVFDCVDNGIVAELQGHDNIKLWKDDSVYVWLDPGHTHSNQVMVQVSAGGQVLDTRNGDPKFDVEGLATEVTRTDTGWRARIRLPWKGLGVSCPQPGDVWGINLTRMDQPGKYDYENMETSSLMLISDGDPGQPNLWGHAIFAAANAKPDDKDIMAAQQALAKTEQAIAQARETDPQRSTVDPDGKTLWYDCKFLTVEGKGWGETESFYDRLPASAKNVVPAAVWGLRHNAAGICVRFTTDSSSINVRWVGGSSAMPHMPATGVSGVDLYGNDEVGKWRFLGNGRPTGSENNASFSTTPGREHILYLPLYSGVKSVAIGVPKNKTISATGAGQRSRKPIVFYGTSITQGGCASRPGMAFTAIVGRDLDVPIINLGFSGSGKMEPQMAELLAELDPSVYVLDCLANMSDAMVKERIDPFVRKLREAHPGTPILLAEKCDVYNRPPSKSLRMVYDKLTTDGIGDLYYLSNADMLGNDGEGTVDLTHPNDLGMLRMAAVLTKALTPILQSSGQARSNNADKAKKR